MNIKNLPFKTAKNLTATQTIVSILGYEKNLNSEDDGFPIKVDFHLHTSKNENIVHKEHLGNFLPSVSASAVSCLIQNFYLLSCPHPSPFLTDSVNFLDFWHTEE